MGCCGGQQPIQPPPPGTPLNQQEASLRNKLRAMHQQTGELWEDIIRNPGKHCEKCLDKLHAFADEASVYIDQLKESIDEPVRREETSVFSGGPDPQRSEDRVLQGSAGDGG